MKKWILLALKLLLAFFLIHLLVEDLFLTPLGSRTETELNKYGRYNHYVDTSLNTRFHELLPNREDAQQCGEEYLYHYNCALLGSPSFSIYLSAEMDEEAFEKEELRISAWTEHSFSAADLQVCFVQGSMDSVRILYDDEILDGYGMFLEIAVLDHSRQEITYFCADLTDGLIRHAHTDAFLQSLTGLCDGAEWEEGTV